MSNTVFTVKSALSVVTAYQSATPEQDLKFAQALLFLTTADPKTYSVRGLVTVSANLSRPVGKSRIATLIKAARTLPETPTVTDWQAAIAAASAANRGRETAATVPPVDSAAESGAENALVTAARAITEPVTLDTLTDRLADLFADARTLIGLDLQRFLASVTAELHDAEDVIAEQAVRLAA